MRNGMLDAPERYVAGYRVVLFRRGTYEPVTRTVPAEEIETVAANVRAFAAAFPGEQYFVQRTILLLN